MQTARWPTVPKEHQSQSSGDPLRDKIKQLFKAEVEAGERELETIVNTCPCRCAGALSRNYQGRDPRYIFRLRECQTAEPHRNEKGAGRIAAAGHSYLPASSGLLMNWLR